MGIDIDAYLTDEQKREIAAEAFRSACDAAFKANPENIISNIGYATATRIVAESLGDKYDELIAAKAVDVIGRLSEFVVFRRPDAWDRESTPAYQILMKAVIDNASLVEAKVRECIERISRRDALEILKSGQVTISTTVKKT